MFNKLTLRDRIFLISSLLILVAIALIWVFIKPQYQETVVKERTTIVSQLQEYTLRQTDHVLRDWLNASIRLSEDLALEPAKAPELSNKAINYTPGLIRVLISDTESSEEIDLVRGIYSEVDFTVPSISWHPSRLDISTNTAWVSSPAQDVDFFITERAFQVGSNVFKLRLYFNAQSLNDNLTSIPLGGTYYTNILNSTGNELIPQNDFTFPSDLIGDNSFSNQKVINIDNKNWFVLSSRFETIPFWHLIAVEDSFILEPVNQLVQFSFYTALVVLLLMLFFSWYVSLRVNRPIKLLLEDVEYLGNLDFDHRIKQVSLPEFQPMHDTLENIRATLSRYQKINVEKIILEEWKNKYMVTYSDDFIGVIGESGTFTFINNQLIDFLESLHLNPKDTSLDLILHHPQIKVSESHQSIHYPDPFTVKVNQSELIHTTDNGVDYYYDFQFISILDETKKEIGAYVIIHDKTEDRLLDIKRNDMINVIIHELKNPITGVVGLSRFIIESENMKEEESKSLIKEVLNSGERMNELVNRFLDVQKLEAGNISLNVTDIDVEETINEVSKLSKPLLTSKKLAISISKSGKDFVIEADGDLVFDSIQNILSNAVKYGDPERTININLKSTDKNVSVAITDYGYGISIENQSKVYDKFFRVKSNYKAAKEKGTGLGLAYVKEIMQRHNGDISLESTPKIGSRFILTFPKKYTPEK
ncbi:MAG: HAMP domain-containing sensor histidine kinase [Balneola sp.]